MPDSRPPLAIVTGAGSGLGRAFCRQLAASGRSYHLVVLDQDILSAQSTMECLESPPQVTSTCEVLNVSDPGAWAALHDRLRSTWPRLELLINNAGICMSAEVGEAAISSWRRIHEVNYGGVLNGCHTMVGWLKESAAAAGRADARRSNPAVINVASIMGLLPAPCIAAYSASKAAVVALSESMYAELRPHGVNVTVAAPGFFASALLDSGDFADQRHRDQADALVRTSVIDADAVARATLRASARGQLYAVMGARARWAWRLKRLAPTAVAKALARRHRRIMIEGPASDIPAD